MQQSSEEDWPFRVNVSISLSFLKGSTLFASALSTHILYFVCMDIYIYIYNDSGLLGLYGVVSSQVARFSTQHLPDKHDMHVN